MNWKGLTRIEEPSSTAITLADAKLYLRIDDTTEDLLITSLIKAATTLIENHLERSLITQTWQLTLDNFNSEFGYSHNRGVVEATRSIEFKTKKFISLPMGRIQSITSLKTYNESNIASIFSTASYRLSSGNDKGRLVLNDLHVWPIDLRSEDAVEIEYVAGFGDSSTDIPGDIKTAIKMIVADVYENRCGSVSISPIIEAIISPYKIYSMG